jgi:protein-S-isoprenylcysteine O-methyltransferase Ste14
MKPVKIIPPAYFYGCMAIMVVLHFALPGAVVFRFPWRLLGVLPLGAGAALSMVADRDFKRRGTSVKPLGETTTLITDGAFRISRHPMYLGFVLVLLGLGMLLGSLLALLPVAAFAVFIDVVFIRFEERKMEAGFGAAWREYKRRVRRWL